MTASMSSLALALVAALAWPAGAQENETAVADDAMFALIDDAADQRLHAPFAELLVRYVRDDGVRYGAWHETAADVARLSEYVDALEAIDPATLTRPSALAFWINLYNAATLELVLTKYPVESIKDIGGLLSSPWKNDVVEVAGETLTLDDIENEVIRPRFGDARIHFALNCASIGCPPLAVRPYVGTDLDEQLDAATVRALGDPMWVDLEPKKPRISKLFDWYRDDFEAEAGSVGAYIARYREIGDVSRFDDVDHIDYDWSLNVAADDVESGR